MVTVPFQRHWRCWRQGEVKNTPQSWCKNLFLVTGSQVFRGLCLAREGLLFKKPITYTCECHRCSRTLRPWLQMAAARMQTLQRLPRKDTKIPQAHNCNSHTGWRSAYLRPFLPREHGWSSQKDSRRTDLRCLFSNLPDPKGLLPRRFLCPTCPPLLRSSA